MDKDDWDYYTYSVGEQLMVILWTSVGTLAVVGFILGIALRQVYDNRTLTTRKVMMMTVKYKQIKVQLIGNDGNAFAIMGTVSKALKQANIPQEDIDAYLQESMSGDYDNLLRTAMKYVEVS